MSDGTGEPTRSESVGMLAGVLDHIRADRRRARRRRALAVTAGAAVVGSAIIAALVLAPLSQRERYVECFEGPSLSSRVVEGAVVDAEVPDPIGTALAQCAALFEAGELVAGPTDGGTATVPQLTACQRPQGTFAVLPSGPPGDAGRATAQPADAEAFCEELGLHAAVRPR